MTIHEEYSGLTTPPAELSRHTFVFVGGLHRSGTSLVHRCLADHPQISGFANTGVPEDEGQHLQSVLLPAKAYGGPGRFGFDRDVYLNEQSSLATASNRQKLFEEWSRHWDLSKPVLLEKSPPNLLRMRFLQALFPSSQFVVVVRNPIAVSFATMRWCNDSVLSLLRHWAECHRAYEADKAALGNLHVIRYEDFVDDPESNLNLIYQALGLEPAPVIQTIRSGVNDKYLDAWDNFVRGSMRGKWYRLMARMRYRSTFRSWGYSI